MNKLKSHHDSTSPADKEKVVLTPRMFCLLSGSKRVNNFRAWIGRSY